MTIEISRQSFSTETVSTPSAALRPSQSKPIDIVKSVDEAKPTRQAIAAKGTTQKESGQQLAEANQVVVQLKDKIQTIDRQLEFRVDKESGKTIIKVKDRETGEIIREIPSEEMIEIGQRLRELAETLHSSGNKTEINLAGLLVQKQA